MKFNNKSYKKFAAVFLIIMVIFIAVLVANKFLFMPSAQKSPLKKKISVAISNLKKTILATPKLPASNIFPSPKTVAYKLHSHIFATVFWVGEKATSENDYIPNKKSVWDDHWMEHYGGADDPNDRNGYNPASFTPKENPFYFALPYNDFEDSHRKSSVTMIPWYSASVPTKDSLLKNKWIKVTYQGNVCYGQWEDVGPFNEDDFQYVFGNSSPKEKRAGLDLSPAMRNCLKMADNDYVDWQFIDKENVPSGPWKDIITTSSIDWEK